MKTKSFIRSAIATAIAIATCVSAYAVPTEMDANDVYLKQIGAYSAWSRGYTGKGVRIGFVDTGADLKNSDLKNVILSKSPYYATINDVDRGHGTAMISLAAGAMDGKGIVGVAYDANVLAYAGGIAGYVLYSDVSKGIVWNADNKADVINLSLGGRLMQDWFNAYYTNPAAGQWVRKPGVADAYLNNTLPVSYTHLTLPTTPYV